MFKSGNTVLVKNTVNSVYVGDTGIVLDTSTLGTENAVLVCFEGKSTAWFNEAALELV